jgi:hypothetical protein
MITLQHEGSLSVIGVFGTLEIEDFHRLEDAVEQQLARHGRIDLLVDLTGMLDYTLDTAIEDIRFMREHARDVGRIAILSTREAVIWSALLSRLFIKAEVRVFDNEASARAWMDELS